MRKCDGWLEGKEEKGIGLPSVIPLGVFPAPASRIQLTLNL